MNTKSTIRHYFARVAILLLLHTVTQGAWADDFITDVMVIGGTKAETNALKTQYQSQGWKVNNQDLNEGAGGDYIYLLYKTASDTDPNAIFITGISCFNTPMSAAMFSDGRTYYAAPYDGGSDFMANHGNLNSNTEGLPFYLCYSKADTAEEIHGVRSITFNNDPEGATPELDLNHGCEGAPKIYMHADITKGWTFWQGNDKECMITDYDVIKPRISAITLPVFFDDLKVIAINMSFSEFVNLEKMTFTVSTAIDRMPSVQGCKKFKQVIGPANIANGACLPVCIKTIPDYAFAGTALKILYLPGVTSVGEGAFEGCDSLELINFIEHPAIGNRAFANNSSNANVYYDGPISNWKPTTYEYSPNLCIIEKDIWYCGWCGGKKESDHNRLFWKLEKTDIINNTLYGHLTIDCDEVEIIYPEYLTIQSHTWRRIDQTLMRIKILTLKHVFALGKDEFKDHYRLETVNLDSDLTSIGAGAFSGCTKLTDIYFDGNETQWDAVTKGNDWKPSSTKEHWHCAVTFNANGHGTAPASQSIQWSNEDKSTEPTALTASGYVFTGWYTDAQCTTPWDFNKVVPGDMTLYAGWAEKQLALNDSSANDLTSYNGQKYTVTLKGRTLYLDGAWNTLCLPFSLNSLTGTPLEGFTVKELDTATEYNGHKSGYDKGTLYLNFKDATGITAGKPYIVRYISDLVISSEADWNTFAQNVSNGTSYEGKVVRLDADINVSTMAGKDGFPFKGTLDGNGHTINISLNGGGQGLALFYTIDGATIQNVKVTGTVTSSYHRPATFAAFVNGSSTIRNCWSSVDIVSTHYNSWIDGGAFVSRVAGGVTLTMIDCAFTGSVTYDANTYSGGSMVGFTQRGATANLTNCIYFPTALALTAVAYNPHIFVSGDERGNLTNCYYNAVAKASILENEGFDGSNMNTASLATALGTNWEVSDNNAIPKWIFKTPVFKSVTINNADPKVVTSEDGKVSFTGNYNPVTASTPNLLYLGADNNLCHPSDNVTLGSCRAYFQLAGGLLNPDLGDVNGDGQISVTDVMAMVSYVLGTVNDGFIVENADINGDGQISVTDVMALVKIILQGSQTISDIIVNGTDGITYGGGGNGPARAGENNL